MRKVLSFFCTSSLKKFISFLEVSKKMNPLIILWKKDIDIMPIE
jgi:hypothetical protein